MKATVIFGIVALGLGAVVGGCQTSKEVASEVSERSVRDFQYSLEQMPGRIDGALATMNTLGSAGPGRKEALAAFSKQLKTLREDGLALADARDRATADRERYFREWLKESRRIKDSAARDQAMDEIGKTTQRLDIARGYLDTGAAKFRTMIDAMNAVETQLTANLDAFNTPGFNRQFSLATDSATAAKARVDRLGELIDAALMGK